MRERESRADLMLIISSAFAQSAPLTDVYTRCTSLSSFDWHVSQITFLTFRISSFVKFTRSTVLICSFGLWAMCANKYARMQLFIGTPVEVDTKRLNKWWVNCHCSVYMGICLENCRFGFSKFSKFKNVVLYL